MRKLIYLLNFVLFPGFIWGQLKNDSTLGQGKRYSYRFFASGGINVFSFYSNKYFSYLFDKAGFDNPLFISNSFNIQEGSTSPNQFSYQKLSTGPKFNVGLEFSSSSHKQLNHIIEVGYLTYTGKYSDVVYYREGDYNHPAPPGNWTYVNDTAQSQYNQTMFSLGYKLQPTYKFVFFSAGVNCNVNLVKIEQQKKEQTEGWYYNEMTNQIIHAYSTSNIINSARKLGYVNFPFEFGVGGYFRIKRIVLKPAFYFTNCFLKGENFYNASLEILLLKK